MQKPHTKSIIEPFQAKKIESLSRNAGSGLTIWFCLFILHFLLFIASTAQAQMRGTVLDSVSRKPLPDASVVVQTLRDSAMVGSGLTDATGRFLIRSIRPGVYRLELSYVGYRTLKRTIRVGAGLVDLGEVSIVPQAVGLKEVLIQQQRAPVAIKGDTIEFNADSFKTQPNAVVEDLFKKLPGVQVSRDGTITAQGQTVQKVLVDGKPFFGNDAKTATRNLPADMIDKVQVFDQKSDQAAFSGVDDGDLTKTINITTKRDKKKGTFGQFTGGAGRTLPNGETAPLGLPAPGTAQPSDTRYSTRFNINRFNNGRQMSLIGQGNNVNQQAFTRVDQFGFGGGGGGFGGINNGPSGSNAGGGASASGNGLTTPGITRAIGGGLNYRDAWGKKVEAVGSYFFDNSLLINNQESRQQNILPDTAYISDRSVGSANTISTHRANLRLDYTINPFTSLRFTPTLTAQTNSYQTQTSTSTLAANVNEGQSSANAVGSPINTGLTTYGAAGQSASGGGTALLLHKFRRRGRTMSVSYTTNLNHQTSDANNLSINTFPSLKGITRTTRTDQQIAQKTDVNTQSAIVSYTEPFNIRQTLELHYNLSYNHNISDRQVNNRDTLTGLYTRLNTQLTNVFDNQFTTHRAGLTFQTRRLKYTYGLGLDLQEASLVSDNRTTGLNLNRSFLNLLPNLSFTYNFAQRNTLRVFARSRINAPSVSQLQPVVDNSNPLSIRVGNPDLKPEFTNTLTANYTRFDAATLKSLIASVSLTQTNRRIVNSQQFAPSGIQTTTPINANGFWSANGFLTLGRPLQRPKANLNTTTNVNYSRSVGFVNGEENRARNLSVGQGISLNTTYNETIEANIGANLTFQSASYSLQPKQNTQFWTQSVTADIYYRLPARFVLTSDMTYYANTGRSAGYNQQFTLWNVGLSQQFLKQRQAEFKVQVFDLLNQNQSVVRNVGDTYVQDVRSLVLKRYVLVSFIYNLRQFGTATPAQGLPGQNRPGRGFGGAGRQGRDGG